MCVSMYTSIYPSLKSSIYLHILSFYLHMFTFNDIYTFLWICAITVLTRLYGGTMHVLSAAWYSNSPKNARIPNKSTKIALIVLYTLSLCPFRPEVLKLHNPKYPNSLNSPKCLHNLNTKFLSSPPSSYYNKMLTCLLNRIA